MNSRIIISFIGINLYPFLSLVVFADLFSNLRIEEHKLLFRLPIYKAKKSR